MRTCTTVARLALLAVFLFVGTAVCFAQKGKQAHSGPPAQPILKLRSMTMAQRWDSAKRNAARKVKAGKPNQVGANGQKGVKP